MDFINETSVGEIHSMYQDLFLTDMKKEVEDAQSELKQFKQETNTANREITILKKEQAHLQATLKRYRKMVQEMSVDQYKGLTHQDLKNLNKTERINQIKRIDGKLGSKAEGYSHEYTLDEGVPKPFPQHEIVKSKTHKRPDSRGSIESSNAPTNINSNWIETSKLEKTLRGLNVVNKATTIMETFLYSIKEIVNNLIQCKSCTVYMFDTVLSEKMTEDDHLDRSHVQKIIIEGRYIDAVGLSDSDIAEPCFKSVEELRYGIRNNFNLAFPILDKQDKIVMGLQLDSKRGKNNKPNGFALMDEHIVKTFCHYIYMKIERMLAKKEAKMYEKNVVDTLQLTSDICTQRTHKGLILRMKNKLPKFMNFEAAGVLLYDKVLDKLYSVTEESKSEEINQDENDTMIKFPATLGITGIVFQSGEIFISNKATKETKMRSDIDNLSSCTDVYNFMISPIYGENKEHPIGIIQFFNK